MQAARVWTFAIDLQLAAASARLRASFAFATHVALCLRAARVAGRMRSHLASAVR